MVGRGRDRKRDGREGCVCVCACVRVCVCFVSHTIFWEGIRVVTRFCPTRACTEESAPQSFDKKLVSSHSGRNFIAQKQGVATTQF